MTDADSWMTDATHWVIIPIDKELRQSGNPRLPANFMSQAIAEFNKIGTIVGGPWFQRYQDGPLVLKDGRMFHADAGIIYYAALEVSSEAAATSDSSSDPA